MFKCNPCPFETLLKEVEAKNIVTCKRCEPGTFQNETEPTQTVQIRASCKQYKEGFYAVNAGSKYACNAHTLYTVHLEVMLAPLQNRFLP